MQYVMCKVCTQDTQNYPSDHQGNWHFAEVTAINHTQRHSTKVPEEMILVGNPTEHHWSSNSVAKLSHQSRLNFWCFLSFFIVCFACHHPVRQHVEYLLIYAHWCRLTLEAEAVVNPDPPLTSFGDDVSTCATFSVSKMKR